MVETKIQKGGISMNDLMIFNNPEFGEIRTVGLDGEPLLVGKDVALALGYTNPQKAIRDHVDDEDKTVNETFSVNGTPIVLINESGLYSLVLSSKLPGAKKFKRWVTSEVLPSIRKHGAYMTSDTIDKMINSPEFGIKLLTALRDEQDKRKALETELDRSKEWYSIKRVAHLNGVSYKVFDWRKLKLESQRQGYGVKKIFDANYGEVNTYHVNVWEKVYPNMEL
jgi:prophage antirepressor-like protein|nr:MAG TPA: repressor domain protein [Caudoviricetes sp.]DAT63389.1 MAG TPA: repressor domain protein [Caudoviricetes sp.]DAW30305.1 MAG TPA: repressor domain protein [Caudoviricetes sp.]